MKEASKYIFDIKMPTEEELIKCSKIWWETMKGVTFLDWNECLLKQTFPLEIVKIPEQLIDIYLTLADNSKLFNDVLTGVENIITPALNNLGCKNSFFIKLISRSPKDAMFDGFEIKSVVEAVKIFANSMRFFEDMAFLKYLPDQAYLVVRPFINYCQSQEWRVIVKDRKITGISQYYYNQTFDFSKSGAADIEKEVRYFMGETVMPNMSVNSFVADIIVKGGNIKDTILLETNPYGLSHPCLFGSYENLDGSFKYL